MARSSTTSPTWKSRSARCTSGDHLARLRRCVGQGVEQALLAEAFAARRRVGDAIGVEEQRVAGRSSISLCSQRAAPVIPSSSPGGPIIVGGLPGPRQDRERMAGARQAQEGAGFGRHHMGARDRQQRDLRPVDEDVVEQAHHRRRAGVEARRGGERVAGQRRRAAACTPLPVTSPTIGQEALVELDDVEEVPADVDRRVARRVATTPAPSPACSEAARAAGSAGG